MLTPRELYAKRFQKISKDFSTHETKN